MVVVLLRAVEQDPSIFVEEKVEGSITPEKVAALAQEKIECFKGCSADRLKVYLESGSEFKGEMKVQEGESFYIRRGEKKEPDRVIRLCLLGPGAVGKSALTLRFTSHIFQDEYDPTIEDAFRKEVEIDGQLAALDILDTAGQEDYDALRSAWYRKKDGLLLLFALDDEQSLEALTKFHSEIENFYTDFSDSEYFPAVLLIGNKADLEHVPNLWQKAEQKNKEWQTIGLLKTSAKTGLNVDAAFANLVRAVRRKRSVKPKTKSWCFLL